MPFGTDFTKTKERPSHEAIESTGGEATDVAMTPADHLDHVAMEGAKRAQNRIHENETKIPGSSIFTK